LVANYLKAEKLNISSFVDNFPSPVWLRGLMKRHNLTKRITDNVKAARAEVNSEVINKIF